MVLPDTTPREFTLSYPNIKLEDDESHAEAAYGPRRKKIKIEDKDGQAGAAHASAFHKINIEGDGLTPEELTLLTPRI